MTATVLILGGTGRIGSSVARFVCRLPDVAVTISGRNAERGRQICQALGGTAQFVQQSLEDREELNAAIAAADLVIHCAGPFLYRDASVLKCCIETKTNYLDVSDSRDFTQLALALRAEAEAAGVTAIINSGIFPGISNSMVRQAAEQLDEPHNIQLSYVVAGSGGAGLTVMRTTFLGLLHPFQARVDGKWQAVSPYSDRQSVTFPHYGQAPVYWFDVPETLTLAESFPSVRTVATKFGSLPDIYNHLTWLMARGIPPKVLAHPATIEFLSYISYGMTQVSDRFTGVGVAIRAEAIGQRQGEQKTAVSRLFYEDTAAAAGMGTAAIADALLQKRLSKPGVWSPEQAVSTEEFEQAMVSHRLPVELEMA